MIPLKTQVSPTQLEYFLIENDGFLGFKGEKQTVRLSTKEKT